VGGASGRSEWEERASGRSERVFNVIVVERLSSAGGVFHEVKLRIKIILTLS